MIRIFVHARNLVPIRKLAAAPASISDRITIHTYQRAFSRQCVPAGTLVFTDFDLLQSYELDAVAHIANTARQQRPDLQILNHPAVACERFDLLGRLHRAGLNPIQVTRLDGAAEPQTYPVFLRAEDGWAGPETGLLDDPAAFRAAVDGYRERGEPLKRRIAVSFAADLDADGFHRKYGAFVIGDRIVSQHIMRSRNWVVKHKGREDDAAFIEEERQFCRHNPHQDWLREVARVGGISFGRIDYGFANGAPVAYEINLNPTFPKLRGGVGTERNARKEALLDQLGAALAEIDTNADASRGDIAFSLAELPGAQFIEREAWYQDLPHSVLQGERWRRALRALRS